VAIAVRFVRNGNGRNGGRRRVRREEGRQWSGGVITLIVGKITRPARLTWKRFTRSSSRELLSHVESVYH
jgi:hypothetical protein